MHTVFFFTHHHLTSFILQAQIPRPFFRKKKKRKKKKSRSSLSSNNIGDTFSLLLSDYKFMRGEYLFNEFLSLIIIFLYIKVSVIFRFGFWVVLALSAHDPVSSLYSQFIYLQRAPLWGWKHKFGIEIISKKGDWVHVPHASHNKGLRNYCGSTVILIII